MASVYSIITERIIKCLEEGTVPWQKPWKGSWQSPKNLVSGKQYRGVNALLLGASGFESPWWLTFKQTAEQGGQVKKGARGFPVVYWRWPQPDEQAESESHAIAAFQVSSTKAPFVRYYTVFNVEQTIGIEYPKWEGREPAFKPLDLCERVVHQYHGPPRIETIYNQAFYRPLEDLVGMPRPQSFGQPEEFYSTLFHELTHSTGHSKRLARRGIMAKAIFADNDYSKEELVAEMGAAFLSGHCGIESKIMDNSAAYINGWVGRLKSDIRLVVEAASQAQKSTDFILNKVKYKDNEEDGQGQACAE